MKKSINIIGFIAAFLLLGTVAMKSNHLPGAGICMALSGFAISLYLPFFLLYRPGNEHVKNSAGVVGAIAASMVNLGVTFKFQHWPGAGPLLVVGLTTFALIFLPMLLKRKIKNEPSARKAFMNACGALGLSMFALGLLFKIQHWPYASVLLGLSVFVLFFGYFLLYLLDSSIEAEAKTLYLRKAFFSIIIGSIVATFILLDLGKPFRPQPPEQVSVEQPKSEKV